MNNTNSSNINRIVWVDILRVLAIFMVICIHCSDPFNVSPEARANPDFSYWGALYGSFLRPCVPLFVMITGILLLPVSQTANVFYKKRLTRILFPFLIWSVLYNLFPWITGLFGFSPDVISSVFAYAGLDASQSFDVALKNILLIPLKFNVYTVPMWYLYMLLGLYLYMPVFSSWVEKATVKEKQFYLGLWFVTLFLPFLYYYFASDLFGLSSWNTFGTFYYFAGFNGYLLLGHYMRNHLNPMSLGKTLAISIPLFLIGYFITYFGFKSITSNPACSEADMEMFFLYCSPNVLFMTVAVFLLVRTIRIKSETLLSALSNIAQCGLGIYVVHYFVVGFCYAGADALNVPISIRIPVTAIFSFIISWAFVAFFFRLIPKASKWIFG